MRNFFERSGKGKEVENRPSASSSVERKDSFRRIAEDRERRGITENTKQELPRITKTIGAAIAIARSLDQNVTAAQILSPDHYDIKQLISLTGEVKKWIKDHQGALGLTKEAYQKMREEYLYARKESEKNPSVLQAKIYVKEQSVVFLKEAETKLKSWITDARGDNLLNAFKENFPAAAQLIQDSLPALVLVQEAARASVQFGGYSEKGIAYTETLNKTVYVPKEALDPIIAMGDFLFELNNGIRSPLALDLHDRARKGELTAKDFAYQAAEIEVEGALSLGEMWSTMKQTNENLAELDQYDKAFHILEYKAYEEKQMSKKDIIETNLTLVYKSGPHQGKTAEQYYTEMYNEFASGASGIST